MRSVGNCAKSRQTSLNRPAALRSGALPSLPCQAAECRLIPTRRDQKGIQVGRLLEIVTPLHKATKRDYLARMVDDKVHCMMKAKEYEFDYWDGARRYGYGGE